MKRLLQRIVALSENGQLNFISLWICVFWHKIIEAIVKLDSFVCHHFVIDKVRAKVDNLNCEIKARLIVNIVVYAPWKLVFAHCREKDRLNLERLHICAVNKILIIL